MHIAVRLVQDPLRNDGSGHSSIVNHRSDLYNLYTHYLPLRLTGAYCALAVRQEVFATD